MVCRINVIQLTLYHLHITDKSKVGYFRWKEDICQLIEDRWDTLLPNKARTASWMNSVSSVLSANNSIFVSGFDKLKQPGWWALRTIQPPKPVNTMLGESKKRKKKPKEEIKCIEEDKIGLSVLRTVIPPLPTRSPMTMDTAHTLLLAKHYVDRIPNVSALLPLEQEATPTTMKAAQEIKRKLVERLLRVDSKLLQEALANAPAPPFGKCAASLTPPPLTNFGAIKPASSILANHSVETKTAESKEPQVKVNPSKKDLKGLQKVAKPPNYVRASPHENELLELCLRVADPDTTLNRFKRKLIMRRTKRRVGVLIFDIDQVIYKYLKSSESLLLQDVSGGGLITMSASNNPQTFFDIPYHRDPTLSFKAKLRGVSNLEGFPFEKISPFTGMQLPAYLYQETRIKPLKLRLLSELKVRRPTFMPDKEIMPSDTIDFVHIRKEWLAQVNRLLRRFFWPSIDMTDALDYPDYGILVMYRKLVIGCAFMTPDGYITYFLIHPEWSGSGLGTILLHLLIAKVAPPHSDVTLHVSATNPAMLLYQKFGFKPEEYIVNFYDKYYREDESTIGRMHLYSKNAFFIRYRRL